jgi:hypothetical protein
VIKQGGPGAGWPILCSLTAKGGLFAPRANRLPQRQPRCPAPHLQPAFCVIGVPATFPGGELGCPFAKRTA